MRIVVGRVEVVWHESSGVVHMQLDQSAFERQIRLRTNGKLVTRVLERPGHPIVYSEGTKDEVKENEWLGDSHTREGHWRGL
jgi:hypothetical protein